MLITLQRSKEAHVEGIKQESWWKGWRRAGKASSLPLMEAAITVFPPDALKEVVANTRLA